MKYIILVLMLIASNLAFAKTDVKVNAKKVKESEIRIIGPAAEELLSLVGTVLSKNISCAERIISDCKICAGGKLKAVCTLNAKTYEVD